MKNIIYLIFSITFFSSCYNTSLSEIKVAEYSGSLVDSETNLPLIGVKTYLYPNSVKGEALDSSVTDEKGFFRYQTISYNENAYRTDIRLDTNKYDIEFATFLQPDPLIFVSPKAYVKCHIKNINSFDSNDKLYMILDKQYSYFFAKGKNIDTTIITTVHFKTSSYPKTIHYSVDKNNKSEHYYLPINPISFDTLQVNINY